MAETTIGLEGVALERKMIIDWDWNETKSAGTKRGSEEPLSRRK